VDVVLTALKRASWAAVLGGTGGLFLSDPTSRSRDQPIGFRSMLRKHENLRPAGRGIEPHQIGRQLAVL
jgi:hypothetical protein